ncbi:MAG: DedA family protein [Caldilinea sp. CFX5]|nr:DedA family protein [Caldilinea sp. CFX5]
MDLQTILLDAMATYGAFALFGAILLAAIGVPLPATFLLVAAGSFVTQGELDLWPVLVAGALGAILGDHIGYGIGRIGGQHFVQRMAHRFNGQTMLTHAENTMQRWGGIGVFLSRWLLTAAGPYVNLTSGLMGYRLLYFSFWDIVGEILWVALYVQVGRLFSDQLATISDTLGDLTWVAVGIVAILVIGYKLIQSFRQNGAMKVPYTQQFTPQRPG